MGDIAAMCISLVASRRFTCPQGKSRKVWKDAGAKPFTVRSDRLRELTGVQARAAVATTLVLIALTFLSGCPRPAAPGSAQGGEGSPTAGGSGGSGGSSAEPALPEFWAQAPGASELDHGLAAGYAIAWVTPDGVLMVATPWWSQPRALASDCGTREFAWGPNATYLTYLAGPEPGRADRFCKVPVVGGDPTEIAGFPTLEAARLPRSSPDGSFYTVELPEAKPPYFRLAVVGGGMSEPLLLNACGSYAWSPDSRILAYGRTVDVGHLAGVSQLSLSSSLCLHDLSDGNETVLVVGDPVNLYWAQAWPKAQELHYIQEESPPGRQSMYYEWVIDPPGGEPRCLGGDTGCSLGETDIIPEQLQPFGSPWPERSPDGTAAIVHCCDPVLGPSSWQYIVVLDPETKAWGVLGEGAGVWSPVPVPGGGG